MEKEAKDKKPKQTKRLIIIVTVLIILGIISGLVFFFISGDKLGQEEKISQENSDNNNVVARVNSQEITVTDLENAKNQILNSQKIDPTTIDENTLSQIQNQALDNLISDILVKEAIAQFGFTVSVEDVDAELSIIKSRFTEDQQYQEALLAEGVSEEDLRSQIEAGMSSQAYFEEVLDLESITATEEEINNLYEQEATTSENIPALEEIYDQIESFVKQQKQQQLLLEHVQKLKDQAEIEIML